MSRILWLLLLALYAGLFVAFCALDTAPLPWDESFFVHHPTAVVAATQREGLFAGFDAFWNTPYHKPPLAMFGTLPFMFVFGGGSVAVRIDNLAVVLLTAWAAYDLLRRQTSSGTACFFAFVLILAPYCLWMPRMEMAEIYLVATAALFVGQLFMTEGFVDRRATIKLGLYGGLGLLSKTSFPLLICGPTLVVFGHSLLTRRKYRAAVTNAAVGGLCSILVAAPFYAKNWEGIFAHVRSHYGWIQQIYASHHTPWNTAHLQRYVSDWLQWYGTLWIMLSVAAIVGAGYLAFTNRQVLKNNALVLVALLSGVLMSAVYCYFHPIYNPRFNLGSLLMCQLLTGVVLGLLLRLHPRVSGWAIHVALVPCLLFLLNNSFVTRADTPLLSFGPKSLQWDSRVPPAPRQAPDLRAEVLARYGETFPGERVRIAFAGDHRFLNHDSLNLRMLELGILGSSFQCGFFRPGHSFLDRVLRLPECRLWMVIESGGGMENQSPYSGHYKEALALFRGNPRIFAQLDWVGSLPDAKVWLFKVTGDIDQARPPGYLEPRQHVETTPSAEPELELADWNESGLWTASDNKPLPLSEDQSLGKGLQLESHKGLWTCSRAITALLPAESYRLTLSYLLEQEPAGSGWGLNVGTNDFHDDFKGHPGENRYQVVFTTGQSTQNRFHVGSYNFPGRALLFAVSIRRVRPRHADFRAFTLGQGETIVAGQYAFKTDLQRRGMASRCLSNYNARFHDYFWYLRDDGDFVIYKHRIGSLELQSAAATLILTAPKALRVEVSSDGLNWRQVERTATAPPGETTFAIGSEQSVPQHFVRLRLQPGGASVKVLQYRFAARLVRGKISGSGLDPERVNAVGLTRWLPK